MSCVAPTGALHQAHQENKRVLNQKAKLLWASKGGGESSEVVVEVMQKGRAEPATAEQM